MPDEAVKKQIEGVCTEITEKNGWTAFAITVEGNQWPVKVSTKLPALIEKGRAVGQQNAVWTFKESQGGENPNKPGTFYTNRYFDDVIVGSIAPTSDPAALTPAPVPAASRNAPSSLTEKDRLIVRQSSLKAAAEIVASPNYRVSDPDMDEGAEAIDLARRFETWVYRDISPPF